MGDVWRAYDTVLDRPVAVKRIRQQSLTSPALAEEFVKRFQREARITARIQHPGVPQVYDAVLDGSHDRLFLVMELVDGVPLSAYVDPARPLPVSWAVAVAAQVSTVLSYAHEVPVIHRDLKPGNVLVARDGTVKVLDFGIAAILRTDVTKLTATGSPLGTYQYMAPEQVRGGRITPQTDLYALGCVLHELLGGRPLFTAPGEYQLMHQHINAAPTPLRQVRADVPPPLEELVLHLLRKAPEARPADTQEVYARLLPFLPQPGEAEPEAVGPTGRPDPTALFRRPYAPRERGGRQQGQDAAGSPSTASPALPPPVPAQAQADIDEAYEHFGALLEEERFSQAAEVLAEAIEPAARALGAENRKVLELRRNRAAIQLLGGDYRAALPEFEALADAYARVSGPTGANARECRAQAARCRAELGQVTDALSELQSVLAVVRAVDSDVSEEAVELRHDIGMLLLAQGRSAEALKVLEPLHEDLCMVLGPDDEMAVEIAGALALIRLDLDGPPA
ncbi:protein kinase [Streptomyces sp. NPDC058052]|uniref:serine/threonine-protein kinase n=1 Tax=Streptomyces sp. NPDC058052 TaxID=3346316 RepID=UPI0036EDCC01